MQTVISQFAFTFADDAIALASGFGRITVELARDFGGAVRSRIMAPIDRLGRACDVAGVLSARDQGKTKFTTGAQAGPRSSYPRRSAAGRFNVPRIMAAFRTLRDLT